MLAAQARQNKEKRRIQCQLAVVAGRICERDWTLRLGGDRAPGCLSSKLGKMPVYLISTLMHGRITMRFSALGDEVPALAATPKVWH